MTLQPAESPHRETTLSCLVVGGERPLAARLEALLERSARVASVERLHDASMLQHTLAARRQDLVVYVLHSPDEPLPRCLLSSLDTRVLVVAPDGIVGTLARWLQQGANDLVSPDDQDGLAHALSRLLDECALAASVRRQQTIIDTQRARIEALLAASRPATAADRDAHAIANATSPGRRGSTAASLSIGAGRRPSGSGVAPTRNRRTSRVTGSVDGLPGRRESLRRLLALQTRAGLAAGTAGAARRARVSNDPQAIALQLTLPVETRTSLDDGRDTRLARTLADLAAYRAAEAVRRCLPRRLLLGRTRGDTLVVLFTCEPPLQHHAAIARLRRSIGTLDGLLERPEDICIDTVHAALSSLATPDLLERLERRRRERTRSIADVEDGAVVQILPVLNARATRPLAAARS